MALDTGLKLGPYEIISAAGAGGMGEVYRATDTRLDRTVAIKILPQTMAVNADLKSRFEREAKAISSLNHPNICTLHDIGNHQGIDYLVMEFLEGETLGQRLQKGPMGIDDILSVAIEICDALEKAHRQGLIHRDLKPGNVMLTKEGAKLMDFGLAKIQMGTTSAQESQFTQTTPLTGTGTILGTLQYMAPEQLEGEEADARSDIFAFGAILYEMITGMRAFDGKSQATLIAGIIGQEPVSISEIKPMVPPGLDRLVKKCMAKQPEKRWQSAIDLADELRWISRSGSQAGIPAPLAARRKFKFNLARVVGAVAISAVVALGYLYYTEITKPLPVVKSTLLPDMGSELNDFAGGSLCVSPNGKMLTFVAVDSSDNVPRLWVRSLNTLTSLPLKGTDNASFPFWSPDSEYLAFFADGKLKKVLATGGPVLTVCDAISGRPGDWNKDDVIIFTPEYQGPLYTVPAAGGEPVQLTSLDSTNNDFTHRYATFLPDGDHFLFFNRTEANAGGERDAICVGSLSDTTVNHLIFAKSNVAYAGGHILFMRESILMAQPFDPGGLELQGNARPIAEDVSFNDDFSRGVFSVSQNGQLIYRKGEVRTGSILRMYYDDFNLIDTIGEAEDQNSFALSNDNNFVAVEVEESQTTTGSDIWIYDLTRKIKRRFTFGSDSEGFPLWSPDDSQIVFVSDSQSNVGLYLKNTYGTEPARLLVEGTTRMIPWSWTPDGKYIVYSKFTPGNAMDMFIYSFDESFTDTVYLATEFMEGGTRVSPDGRWIAYSSNESGKWEVYVSTFPKHTVKWQVSLKGGGLPKWSPDGRRLYFGDLDEMVNVAEVDGRGETFRVGKVTPLFKMNQTNLPGFEVFNDEKRIIASEIEQDLGFDQMIHVLNWPEELR